MAYENLSRTGTVQLFRPSTYPSGQLSQAITFPKPFKEIWFGVTGTRRGTSLTLSLSGQSSQSTEIIDLTKHPEDWLKFTFPQEIPAGQTTFSFVFGAMSGGEVTFTHGPRPAGVIAPDYYTYRTWSGTTNSVKSTLTFTVPEPFPAKYWDGNAWRQVQTAKCWTGSGWVDVKVSITK